ncbi:borealin [Patella vulgata]|uniref:borealin n=1 Tax=Patella vulgata TaxID=6465 RepID=UPI0021800BF6|nr:borealin [Patella vulgata]XP_050398262.1 borealin [Patella vulgata]
MPRKRPTRVNNRAQPKCPEGDEGKSLTEDERMEKLRIFTKDFDMRFNEILEKMEKDKTNIMKTIESRLHCQIMQLPGYIRKMKLKDFIASGGTVKGVLAPSQITEPSSLNISGKLAQTISKLNPNIFCGVIPEEDEAATPCAEKRTVKRTATKKTTVRKSSRKRNTKGNESYLAPPPSSSRLRMTPAGRTMSSAGWATPLITPKFDPRLPFTPGLVRDPKPGERILSMAGSPINNPTDTKKGRSTIKAIGKSKLRKLVSNTNIKEELDDIEIPDSPTDIKNMRQSQIFKVMNIVQNAIRSKSEEDDDDDDEVF